MAGAKKLGVSLLMAFCACGPAKASLEDAVRYQEILSALTQDGWTASDKSYYGSVLQRIAKDQNDPRLQKLKYYCELIPACTVRDLYVIMIWGLGGRFDFTDLSRDHHPAIYQRLHHGDVKGAYLVGFWDNYFARRPREVSESDHTPPEPWPAWQPWGNPWAPGLGQLESFIRTIPRESKLIVVGTSLGGGTAAALAGMLASAGRSIDHLLLFDPIGIYGWRREAIGHRVQSNVKQFFNIWQEKGCWPADYGVSGRFHVVNPQYTESRQELFTGGSDSGCDWEGGSVANTRWVHSETWTHGSPQRIARELMTAIDQAIAPAPPIGQSHSIDGSTITVATSGTSSSPDQVRFELDTSMHWWTAIRVFRAVGDPYWIEREHRTGPYNVITSEGTQRNSRSISSPISNLAPQVKIEFWTAKFLDIHTYMAETVIDRDAARGRVVRVSWPAPVPSEN